MGEPEPEPEQIRLKCIRKEGFFTVPPEHRVRRRAARGRCVLAGGRAEPKRTGALSVALKRQVSGESGNDSPRAPRDRRGSWRRPPGTPVPAGPQTPGRVTPARGKGRLSGLRPPRPERAAARAFLSFVPGTGALCPETVAMGRVGGVSPTGLWVHRARGPTCDPAASFVPCSVWGLCVCNCHLVFSGTLCRGEEGEA